MNLNIPAGQSVRAVAERLGVPVDDLKRHAGVADVDSALPMDRVITIPDGLLEARRPQGDVALPGDSPLGNGMNAWLALDVERKRTRNAGADAHKGPRQEDSLALAEAETAYLRFETDSHALAIDLWQPLTLSQRIDVRAVAFAGQACAYAERALLFGEAERLARSQALSAAKGALMADPKLVRAHTGMALGLMLEPGPTDLQDSQDTLERAIHLDSRVAGPWAALSRLTYRSGRMADAAETVKIALELDANFPLALEIAALLALASDKHGEAQRLCRVAIDSTPTYANVHAVLAEAEAQAGQQQTAKQSANVALQLANSMEHREALEARLDSILG